MMNIMNFFMIPLIFNGSFGRYVVGSPSRSRCNIDEGKSTVDMKHDI